MTDAEPRDESLHRELAVRLADAKVPGCSVGVVAADGRRWVAVFGLRDIVAAEPVRPDTVFHLFSATKLYTAAAVMVLVERGLVGLDDPVATHLPELGLADPVTVRQLASHTSGLADTLRAFVSVHFPDQRSPSTREALAGYRLDKGTAPGEVAYRNVNFAILGELVSRVAGQPYEDFVAETILEPLGSGAGFGYSAAMRSHAATGYLARFDPMRAVLRVLAPDTARRLARTKGGGLVGLEEFALDSAAIGGLVGAAGDFLPFLSMFLDAGDGVLRRGSREAMLSLQAEGKAGIASTVGVGLGWKAGDVDGTRFWNHEGGGPGFASETRLYPADGLGVVILMNRTHKPGLSLLAHDLCELIRLP